MSIQTRNPDFSKPTLIFGGSFDPIHNGHLRIVEACRRELPFLESVLLLPCAHSPGKTKAFAKDADRIAWLEMAALPGMQIWLEEIDRGGESFMVDTLSKAHAQGASRENLYLLLGSDSYGSLDKWKDPDRLRELATIVVAERPGYALSRASDGDRILAVDPLAMSSTEIRDALARGEIPPDMLPEAVSQDIRQRILYSQNPYAK